MATIAEDDSPQRAAKELLKGDPRKCLNNQRSRIESGELNFPEITRRPLELFDNFIKTLRSFSRSQLPDPDRSEQLNLKVGMRFLKAAVNQDRKKTADDKDKEDPHTVFDIDISNLMSIVLSEAPGEHVDGPQRGGNGSSRSVRKPR